MAAWKYLSLIIKETAATSPGIRNVVSPKRLSPRVLVGLAAAGAGAVLAGGLLFHKAESRWRSSDLSRRYSVYAAEEQVQNTIKEDTKEEYGCAATCKQRFKQFASIEYEGELFMTPRDFLFSVIQECTGGGDNVLSGLISYTEYLFLLGILTKPHTGFHVAFSMLDTDGNQQVEKKEFLVLQSIIRQKKEVKLGAHSASKSNKGMSTTLLVHFFGKGGNRKLQYKDFYRFMEDLQTEVQEIEFTEFSRGMKTMRREEFAAWLLHFTEEQNRNIYWKNVRKLPPGESISFQEFRAFCHFMNHLEDFAFTMNMFTAANRPVGIGQFKRAVKVATGQELSDNVLDTVFRIFDVDGDGCLSKQEFLGVIMTRLHRGLKVPIKHGFKGYFKCVKKETIVGVHEAWKQTGRSPC
ncbi:calcium uptake protein 2, mitochondrial isoform X2 [Chiloscyllium plagiosum]|uniref:calcium uptake protein 2, mitochondrial isoform X2 n=1 Tax=Chiloscyllium plagiosum TaxID=36176 RepID=UPI001CB84DFE|nr:calcium uptake protein 2, mitochondrial isoform X2 [Chiloscyllium plagiosum]